MDGVGGYAGWRWIFILEGLLTVVVALFAPFAIHDSPETATFLTEDERRFVIHSLRIQNSADAREMVQDEDKFQTKYVLDAFKDWQIWLGLFSMLQSSSSILRITNMISLVYWGITCPLYGISLFLPSIIKDLGYASSTAQLLTVSTFPTIALGVYIVLINAITTYRYQSILLQHLLQLLQPGSRIVESSDHLSFYSSWP